MPAFSRWLAALALVVLAIVAPAETATAFYSPFFGKDGDNWKPTARMADWSYAGYKGELR